MNTTKETTTNETSSQCGCGDCRCQSGGCAGCKCEEGVCGCGSAAERR